MAAHKILFLFLILLFIELDNANAKRGGGGSRGGWGGRSRSSGGIFGGRSRSSSGRSYISRAPVLSGRILTGSSPFTRLTWYHAAMAGSIYGGARYVHRFPRWQDRHDMPPICTNRRDKSPEGNVYGYFLCPRDNEADDKIYCCGPEHREYCCNRMEAEAYISQLRRSQGLSVGAIVGIVIAVLVVIVLVVVCGMKRKRAKEIISRKFSKKGNGRIMKTKGKERVTLNGHMESHDRSAAITPMVPPPSYCSATSQAGYDGQSGLPYGGKPGLPSPGIDAGSYPYAPSGDSYPAPYPPATGAPYPYPPTTDAPYPTAGAPYPPATDAPYPMAGAPYPPATDAPYPMAGAPYPPTTGAPYPPATDAPYPPATDAPYQPPSYGGDAYHASSPPHPSPNASAPPFPDSPPTSSAAYDGSKSHLPYSLNTQPKV